MDERELTSLLRSPERTAKRGWRCPDENQLARYLDKQLRPDLKQKLETHFADCKACLETLAFISQASNELINDRVPPQLLVRARALVSPQPGPAWRWRWALATATACLLVVLGTVIWKSRTPAPAQDLVAQSNHQPGPFATPVPTSEPSSGEVKPVNQKPKQVEAHVPVVRGSQGDPKPTLLSPREGAVVKTERQLIRWKSVEGAGFYEVRIVSEDGTPVLTKSTSLTELQLSSTAIHSGGKYFVKVVAHLSNGRNVESELVRFRVGP